MLVIKMIFLLKMNFKPHLKLLPLIKGKAVRSVLLAPATPLERVTHHSAGISMSVEARVQMQSEFIRTAPDVDGKTADMEENITFTHTGDETV